MWTFSRPIYQKYTNPGHTGLWLVAPSQKYSGQWDNHPKVYGWKCRLFETTSISNASPWKWLGSRNTTCWSTPKQMCTATPRNCGSTGGEAFHQQQDALSLKHDVRAKQELFAAHKESQKTMKKWTCASSMSTSYQSFAAHPTLTTLRMYLFIVLDLRLLITVIPADRLCYTLTPISHLESRSPANDQPCPTNNESLLPLPITYQSTLIIRMVYPYNVWTDTQLSQHKLFLINNEYH